VTTRIFHSIDAIALTISTAAEIRSILAAAHFDTKKAAAQHLEALGFTEDDYDAVMYDWAQEQYDAGSAAEHEEWGYRWWADEARGARL